MRSRVLVIVLVVVAAALVAAIPSAIRYAKYTEARAAVSRYAVALDSALANLDPAALGSTATDRENGRVTSYITLLWDRDVYVESELLDMDVLRVRSGDPTVTAIVAEKWRFAEHNRKSRKQLGKPEIEQNTLRYTLMPGADGELAVYLSEILDDEELKAELAK